METPEEIHCEVKKYTVPMRPIDNTRCTTVGNTIAAMEHCGAQAWGLAHLVRRFCEVLNDGNMFLCVYDEEHEGPLWDLVCNMKEKKWFSGIMNAQEYLMVYSNGITPKYIIVVGQTSQYLEKRVKKKVAETTKCALYINPRGEHISDGDYRNAVIIDPRFVLPLLDAVAEERLHNHKTPAEHVIHNNRHFGGEMENLAAGIDNIVIGARDRSYTTFLTMSGIVSAAGMGPLISDCIEAQVIDVIGSTGAILIHDLAPTLTCAQYIQTQPIADELLAKIRYNRIGNVNEREKTFDAIEKLFEKVLLTYPGSILGTHELNQLLGAHLFGLDTTSRSILAAAYRKGVPVVIDAPFNWEGGNDVYLVNKKREQHGLPHIIINQNRDRDHIIGRMQKANRMAIWSLGSGGPRNDMQNYCPLIELYVERFPERKLQKRMFDRITQLIVDYVYPANFAASTPDEMKAWRKAPENTHTARSRIDFIPVLPFFVPAILSRI